MARQIPAQNAVLAANRAPAAQRARARRANCPAVLGDPRLKELRDIYLDDDRAADDPLFIRVPNALRDGGEDVANVLRLYNGGVPFYTHGGGLKATGMVGIYIRAFVAAYGKARRAELSAALYQHHARLSVNCLLDGGVNLQEVAHVVHAFGSWGAESAFGRTAALPACNHRSHAPAAIKQCVNRVGFASGASPAFETWRRFQQDITGCVRACSSLRGGCSYGDTPRRCSLPRPCSSLSCHRRVPAVSPQSRPRLPLPSHRPVPVASPPRPRRHRRHRRHANPPTPQCVALLGGLLYSTRTW